MRGATAIRCDGGGPVVAGMGTEAVVDAVESAQVSASAAASTGVETFFTDLPEDIVFVRTAVERTQAVG